MSLLSAADLAGMRATAAQAFPDACTIERKTVVSDGGGGQTETWAPLAAGVACRISPLKGGEATSGTSDGASAGDRALDETTHVVTMANGQDITEADRIVIGARSYEVLLVRQRGEWELTRRVDVQEAP